MRIHPATLVLLLAVILSGCLVPLQQDEGARVVSVVDGDTIDVRVDGTVQTVRLVGVDTPETRGDVSPSEFGFEDTPAVRTCLRNEADEATKYVEDRVGQQEITLERDPNTDNRGGFGRLLRYVVTKDGASLNKELVEKGYARVYRASDFSREQQYIAAEREAKRNNSNVWSCGESRTSYILEVNADAAGDDRENLNDEYVIIQNPTNRTLSLDGWSLSDRANHVFTFDNRTVAPNESVTVRTGRGYANETVVYWNSSTPIWNNNGDTVTLKNESGGVIEQQTYGS